MAKKGAGGLGDLQRWEFFLVSALPGWLGVFLVWAFCVVSLLCFCLVVVVLVFALFLYFVVLVVSLLGALAALWPLLLFCWVVAVAF